LPESIVVVLDVLQYLEGADEIERLRGFIRRAIGEQHGSSCCGFHAFASLGE
jgi:hypothetical protein